MPPKKARNIHIPAILRHHNIRLKTFLSRYKQYTNLAVHAFIFYPPKADIVLPPPPSFVMMRSNSASKFAIEPARLLILAHAPILSDIWEVPGGDCELTDRTILHSVARVTFEKTGLRLKKFVRQIGDGEEFKTSEGLGFNLNFEIEVVELADVGYIERYPTLNDLNITLDGALHREFNWATGDDLRDDIYPVVTAEQKAAMLRAFTLRKEDEQEMRALAISEDKAWREEERAEKVRKGEEYAEKMRKKGKQSVEIGEDDDDDDQDDGEEDDEEDDEEENPYKKTYVKVKRGFFKSY